MKEDNYKIIWILIGAELIDGDVTVIENTDYSLVHDFTLGEFKIDKTFDLVYRTEFLEHVEENI